MVEEGNVENNITVDGIKEANIESLEKNDQIESGLQQPVKLAGVADKEQKVYGEKQQAPIAAPIQQIAPVSANGEQTSSREAMKTTDAPVNVQVSQTGASNHNPSAQEAYSPSAAPVENQQEESEPEVAFEDLPPLEQANHLLQQIPGKFRLY